MDILVCPMCNGKLEFIKKENVLLCRFDRTVFPIDDEIPVMLPEEGKSIGSEEMEELCKNR
ncbi:MAG: Trm112 family protein [Kangiellaceae bacterium]|nr:Trm112 family protein [Kangiellaceae bacterium]MCW9017650.1 Trm112 family protein [Kangiellaceae bacterium]